MQDFEERYSAWLDGTLSEKERAEFEASLPDREAALRDAAEWNSLRGFLREMAEPAPMPHGDFVNSQILAAIERETPKPVAKPERKFFPIGRLVWAGAFLLAVASAMTVWKVKDTPDRDRYVSSILAAHASDSKFGATSFAAPGGRGTVLWVQDAGYIPANERIK